MSTFLPSFDDSSEDPEAPHGLTNEPRKDSLSSTYDPGYFATEIDEELWKDYLCSIR